MKPRKKIPTFKDEDAEREFWGKADSTEYIDWSQAQKLVLPNFRPTLRTISLRLPESMIAELKLLANQRDVPYQSLLKVFLAERIKEERSGTSREGSSALRKRAR
jgi:predicted DNA binding CopG/RHH family protein